MKVDILNKLTNGLMREDDYPADKEFQLVGQRCGQNGQLNFIDSTYNSSWRLNNYSEHYIPTGASAIKLIYSGMYLQAAIPGEKAIAPNVFEAENILKIKGGTGYAIGEVLTFDNYLPKVPPLKLMITSVSSSGMPLTANILDGGIYVKPLFVKDSDTISISSMTCSEYQSSIAGYTVTVVTSEAHGLVTGSAVTISGASPAGYNGGRQITVVDSTTFTFFILQPLATPATGTITAESNCSQLSSSASGTGATFEFNFKGYAVIGHIGIEPDSINHKNTFVGEYAVVNAKMGMKADGTIERRIRIPMGGIVETDSIPVNIPEGGKIGIRATWIGQNYPTGRVPNNTGHGASVNKEQAFKGTSWFDQSNSGNIGFGEAQSAYLFQPAAIMGIPKKKLPVIFAFGDSRTVGSGSGQGTFPPFDSVDDYGNVGCFERALSQDYGCFYPWTNFSKGGIALDHYFNTSTPNLSGHQGIISLIAKIRPTAVYLYLCTNDINTGQSFETVQLREQQLIAEIRGCGVKYVFTSTMEPYTTSTDQWKTLENQTPVNASYEVLRNQRNTALIEGTYADYDFVVDNRLRTEPSIDSNKWIVNGESYYATGDGIHASNIFHKAQAEGISEAIKANIPL